MSEEALRKRHAQGWLEEITSDLGELVEKITTVMNEQGNDENKDCFSKGGESFKMKSFFFFLSNIAIFPVYWLCIL